MRLRLPVTFRKWRWHLAKASGEKSTRALMFAGRGEVKG